MAKSRRVRVENEIDGEVVAFSVTMDERNSELCDEIWNALPIKTAWVHAMVSGELMYAPVPIVGLDIPIHHREPYDACPVGTMTFSPWFHDLSCKYGPVTETLLTTPWGRIDEADLDEAARGGRAVWDSNVYTKIPVFVTFKQA